MWMMSGGHNVDVWGRGPRSNNILDFIECSNDSQDTWGSQDRQYSTSLVRNLLYHLLHTSWLIGNALHTSTSRPPDVTHVIGSQAFPVLCTLPLPCIVLKENRRTKKGEAWKQGYFQPLMSHIMYVRLCTRTIQHCKVTYQNGQKGEG